MTSEKRQEELLRGSLNALTRGLVSALQLARETRMPFWIWREGKCVDLLAAANARYEDAVEACEPVVLLEEPHRNLEEEPE